VVFPEVLVVALSKKTSQNRTNSVTQDRRRAVFSTICPPLQDTQSNGIR
jgi:hypothetical protein